MERQKKEDFKAKMEAFLAKYSFYLQVFLILVFGYSLVRNVFKTLEVEKRIKKEKAKIEILKKETEDLQRKIAETQSQEYVEKQLRDKLGLARTGEIIIVLPPKDVLKKLAPVREEETEILPDPTWKKWFRLFI